MEGLVRAEKLRAAERLRYRIAAVDGILADVGRVTEELRLGRSARLLAENSARELSISTIAMVHFAAATLYRMLRARFPRSRPT